MTTSPPLASVVDAPPQSDQVMQRVRDLVESHLLALAMPATVEAITRELTSFDCALLVQHGGQPEDAVAATLSALVARGDVSVVPGGYAPRHLTADVSRRARTLTLCGRAAVAYGRAVRAADVWRYANDHAPKDIEVGALTMTYVARDLQNLTTSGHLVIIGTVRGEMHGGRNLVVPSHFITDDVSWAPTEPLTWLEYLSDAIRRMLALATRDSFTAKELRAFLQHDLQTRAAENRPTPAGDISSLYLRASLQNLAEHDAPFLRPVSGRSAVWTLVSDEGAPEAAPQAPPLFSSDTDRVMEAALRVTRHGARPVLTCQEVCDTIAADPALSLSGTTGVSKVLADLAKERLSGGGCRRQRQTQRVRKVGKLDGDAVYWVATDANDAARWQAAQCFVQSRGVLDDVERGRFLERIAKVEKALSPVIAMGRVRQLVQELEQLLVRAHALPEETAGLADRIHELDSYADTLRGWLRFRKVPATESLREVQHQPVGLTASALRDLFAPINDKAKSLTNTASIVSLYWAAIRRVPNPRFRGLRSGDPVTSAKFLFDQTDAITYAARQWGGPTCQLHALWASEELGDLRDVRYVLAALRAGTASVRARVVGALALLPSPDAADILVGYVRNDVTAGVRECALWALGMVLGDQATPMLSEVAKQDPDPRVRRTAMAFLAIGDSWWWRA